MNLTLVDLDMDDSRRLKAYRGQPTPQINFPTHFTLLVDPRLLKRLLTTWQRFFVKRSERPILRELSVHLRSPSTQPSIPAMAFQV